MPGQWIEDPHHRSGWRWDDRAPDPDPSPTHLLNAYSSRDIPLREVPLMSADTTARDDRDPGPSTPAYDPRAGAHYSGRDLFAGPDTEPAPAPYDTSTPPVACPTCGSGVHPNRIRG